jgi:GMP synthase-like glutamine amidotransferase
MRSFLGALDSHQAFRFGSRAYGLQFHIEPTGLIDETETKRMQVDETGQKVISRFFDLALNNAENARR